MPIATNNVRMFGVSGTPINFSGLSTAFKLVNPFTSPTPVRASELLRDISTSVSVYTTPFVPNAIENVGIASTANLRLSQFRNSIKFFEVYQTGVMTSYPAAGGLPASGVGTVAGIDVSGIWSGNLGRNIEKKLYIGGTCGSFGQQVAAIRLGGPGIASVASYNLNILVAAAASVYGSGGDPGITTLSPGGRAGGDAINVHSSGNKVRVYVKTGSVVYGGGGGGGKGATGQPGAQGVCYKYNDYTRNSGCEFYGDCGQYTNVSVTLNGTTYNTYGATQTGGNRGVNGCDCNWLWCSRTNISDAQCRKTDPYIVQGAPGGLGGNGAKGRGYDNFSGNLNNFAAGGTGTTGGCGDVDYSIDSPPNYGGTGNDGSSGNSGGNWGQPGNAGNQASTTSQFNVIPGIRGLAGPAGRAVGGRRYEVIRSDGTLPDTNIIKGAYQE